MEKEEGKQKFEKGDMFIKGVGTIKRGSFNLTNYGFLNDEPFRVTK